MSDTRDDFLERLLAADVNNLLATPEKPKPVTSSDRLERSFIEIVEFYRTHGRRPCADTLDIAERKLGARLDGFHMNEQRAAAVIHLDEYGLLEQPDAEITLEEMLAGGSLDFLTENTDADAEEDIFNVDALPRVHRKDEDFTVERRKKAKDFAQFKQLFAQAHEKLENGEMKTAEFAGLQSITAGRFFVHKGIMLFVAEMFEAEKKYVGGAWAERQRIRVIFENGTESNMYRSSLSLRLHEAGSYAVIPVADSGSLEDFTDPEKADGHIYVLRSLSDAPEIKGLRNLYKIGFTKKTVAERIAGATESPTYLYAPVEVVADYRVYGMKVAALEHLLHRVFAEVRLDIAALVPGAARAKQAPSEWFMVPLEIINQAIDLIASGDIVNYRYEKAVEQLMEW